MKITKFVTKFNSLANGDSLYVLRQLSHDDGLDTTELLELINAGGSETLKVLTEAEYNDADELKVEVDCDDFQGMYFQKLELLTSVFKQVETVIESQYNQNELTDSEVVWIESEDLLLDIKQLQYKLLAAL